MDLKKVKEIEVVQTVDLTASLLKIKEGDTVKVDAREVASCRAVRASVARRNKEAGFEMFTCQSINNDTAMLVTRNPQKEKRS